MASEAITLQYAGISEDQRLILEEGPSPALGLIQVRVCYPIFLRSLFRSLICLERKGLFFKIYFSVSYFRMRTSNVLVLVFHNVVVPRSA